MVRAVYKSMSVEERMKQNYIQQLLRFGVNAGPNNEPLQSMNNADLCRMVTRESLKRN